MIRTISKITYFPILVASILLALVVFLTFFSSGQPTYAQTAPSPTGREPKLIWTPERQAMWERMRTENHPMWQILKNTADRTATSSQRHADLGQWASLAYQITGDTTYARKAWTVIEPIITNPPSNANQVRENFVTYGWMYDWIYPALTAEERATYINGLNGWVDYVLGINQELHRGGFRIGDSDQTVGQYFGLAFVDLATGPENPRAGTLLTATIESGVHTGMSVGGLDATAADRTTVRNALREYGEKLAAGGEWIESSVYNQGTATIWMVGIEGVATATGQEHFPEYRTLIIEAAKQELTRISPELDQIHQWGDEEHPRDFYGRLFHWLTPIAVYQGLSQGEEANPYLHDLFDDVMTKYGGFVNLNDTSRQPWFRAFLFYNPYAPKTDWRTYQPHGHFAPGVGLSFFRSGWQEGDSLFASFVPEQLLVDHRVNFLGDFQLWRKGEWAITNPLGYGVDSKWDSGGTNTMLIGGLSAMQEIRGAITHEFGENNEYAYHVGATGGRYTEEKYWNPPPQFLQEWTRSLLYLPSSDNSSDTVVVYDRTDAQNPNNLPNTDRYRSTVINSVQNFPALKQWIIHMPVVPTVTNNLVSWNTTGGQNIQVQTLSPEQHDHTLYNETELWAAYPEHNVPSRERKYQVRVNPQTEQQWDTFLHVVQASDPSTTLINTRVVSSSGAAAEGVLLQRQGENDVVALFNATQGEAIPETPLNGSVTQHNPEYRNLINAKRLLDTGYTATLTSATATTDLFLADLDPAKNWTLAVDNGSPQLLTVPSTGLAKTQLSGTGEHTLVLTATDAPPDTTPPIINNIAITPDTNSVTVTWTTDESARSHLDWGTDTSYGNTTSQTSSAITSHSSTISGLTAGTTYHVRITVEDAAGNITTSADQTFITEAGANTAPTITLSPDQETYEVRIGETLNISITGTDTDGNAITLETSNLAEFAGARFE